ncbi:hypothetical protein [Hymenobacter ruricola]|uniref:Uncharacterized protein n=1 Tax=Hymenobacter ruricola TaxID=2791023 RepID=A0ABS0I0Z4_9BACT|nr:hypothetical protein [Hymenobacter ruricola]MBF9220617.1 hypothetical protein [Hymenobacter ruricola]
MPDYIPAALPKFTDWVGLQTRKRPDYAAALGLSPAEVTARAAADAAVLQATTDAADALATSAAKVAARDQAIRAYQAQARADIARAKTAPGYSEAIGKDCEWLTTTEAVDPATLQPSLEISPSAEGLVLKWSKNGQDGVNVYRRPAGTQDWGLGPQPGLRLPLALHRHRNRPQRPLRILRATHEGRPPRGPALGHRDGDARRVVEESGIKL